MTDIHADDYVKNLFDEMSQTYGLVHLFSSLGFAYFWRKACVFALGSNGEHVCDLMTGGAESLTHIKARFGPTASVDLVDFSDKMCAQAEGVLERNDYANCKVINCNALALPFEASSYDAVVSTFGLKTLSPDDFKNLAKEIKRILKPGGEVSLLEFSIPQNSFIRFFFQLYVKYYVPLLGRLLLGNPDNYRMLWRYTVEFQNCKKLINIFEQEGFKVAYRSHFLGSATQIIGRL